MKDLVASDVWRVASIGKKRQDGERGDAEGKRYAGKTAKLLAVRWTGKAARNSAGSAVSRRAGGVESHGIIVR